jgi:hypothetical protein
VDTDKTNAKQAPQSTKTIPDTNIVKRLSEEKIASYIKTEMDEHGTSMPTTWMSLTNQSQQSDTGKRATIEDTDDSSSDVVFLTPDGFPELPKDFSLVPAKKSGSKLEPEGYVTPYEALRRTAPGGTKEFRRKEKERSGVPDAMCLVCHMRFYGSTKPSTWFQCRVCKDWLHAGCSDFDYFCKQCIRDKKQEQKSS